MTLTTSDLVAYCSPETGDQLPTVDDIPQLAALRDQIPEGKYQPARSSKGRTRPDSEPEEFTPGGTLIEFSAQEAKPSPPTPTPAIAAPIPTREISYPTSADVSLPRLTTDCALRRDPHWVLDNYVAVSPDICQSRSAGTLSQGPNKAMPPLLYMRYRPYRPRHPLDNDALRAFDTVP